jgi:hypothetical protein
MRRGGALFLGVAGSNLHPLYAPDLATPRSDLVALMALQTPKYTAAPTLYLYESLSTSEKGFEVYTSITEEGAFAQISGEKLKFQMKFAAQ